MPLEPRQPPSCFHSRRRPSYAGTSDALISESDPTINFGTANVCGADGSDPGNSDLDLSTLLRWNITDIPPGTTVQSASITLNVTNRSPQTYELYEVKRNWVETEASWDVYASGSNWEVGGAKGTLDRGTVILGTVSASSTGPFVITLNVDGVAVVQSWVDDPGSNRGLIIADSGNNNGVDFDCREVAIPAERPKLTVTHIPPAGNQVPTIISTPLTAATVGAVYTYDVDATGNPVPTYTLTVAPAGMTIDGVTGLISWTPTATGTFDVTVEASNTEGTDSQTFTIPKA